MQRYCSEACQAEAKRARVMQKNNLFKVAQPLYNPQIQISAESGTKRSIFRQKNKTKRSKKRLRTTLIKSEQKVNETSVPALYFRKNTFRMAF